MRRPLVLINGISSFLGCHLVQGFAEAGYEVQATWFAPFETLDPLRRRRRDWSRRYSDGETWLDFRDRQSVHALIAALRPDVIVQQAGIGRDFSSEAYAEAAADVFNETSLEAIFPAAAEVGSKVVMVGSSMEYGASAYPSEGDDCRPQTRYGASRLRATLLAEQLAHLYSVPTRVGRVFSICGELDSSDKFVARVFANLTAKQPVFVAPNVSRDIVDVEDVVEAFIGLSARVSRDPMFDIYNICRGTAVSLYSVAVECSRLLGADPRLVQHSEAVGRPGDPLVIAGDSRKARDRLQWSTRDLTLALERLAGHSSPDRQGGDQGGETLIRS